MNISATKIEKIMKKEFASGKVKIVTDKCSKRRVHKKRTLIKGMRCY